MVASRPTLTLQSRAGPAAHGRGQAPSLPFAVVAAVVLAAADLTFTNPPYTAEPNHHTHGCLRSLVRDRGRSQSH